MNLSRIADEAGGAWDRQVVLPLLGRGQPGGLPDGSRRSFRAWGERPPEIRVRERAPRRGARAPLGFDRAASEAGLAPLPGCRTSPAPLPGGRRPRNPRRPPATLWQPFGLTKPLDILSNPKRIASLGPGLRLAAPKRSGGGGGGTSYPGFKHRKNHQPCKGCSTAPTNSFSPPCRGMNDRAGDRRSNPFRVDAPPHRTPRVARASRLRSALRRGTAQPLGFEPESLWDSHRVRSRPKSSRQAQSVGLESGS